jgi:hypothetical protein
MGNTIKFSPEVVGVEKLEGLDGFKVVDVLFWNLSNLEQPQFALVLDEGTALHVRPCFVRHFHDELGTRLDVLGVEQQIQNVEVDSGTQVVNIGDKTVLAPLNIFFISC